MKIHTRYLVREMVVPFLIGQCAIVLMLTGSVLYNNASIFLTFQVPIAYVARLALYFIPFLINMTMPVAMAVATSLAVSRLSRDSEITVMRAAGVSLTRIFMPIFVTGLVVSVGDFCFGEYVVPAAVTRFYAVLGQLPGQLKHLTPLAGQYFISSDQKFAIGVVSMKPQHGYIELRGVQIFTGIRMFYSTDWKSFAVADRGRYQDGVWTLDHPDIYYYNTSEPDKIQRVYSQSMSYRVPVDPEVFESRFQLQMPMGTMAASANRTFSQLGEELKNERAHHFTDYNTLLDYNFKLSVPFSCLVMALCCAPIAMRFGRGGGFMGTLVAICLVFVYWNTLLLARILGSPGPEGTPPLLSPFVAAWSQNVLFILLGLLVLVKSE